MHNILALDTSTSYLSLGLITKNSYRCIDEEVGASQSNYLIPKIDELLMRDNLTIKDINLIVYNQGPGAFTGLRIGLSVILGISLGLNIPYAVLNSFEIIFQAIEANLSNLIKYHSYSKLLIALDAKLNQLYVAGFNLNDSSYFLNPTLIDAHSLPYVENCFISGDGFSIYKDLIDERFNNMQSNILVPVEVGQSRALNMIELIKRNQHRVLKPQEELLLYLRNKVALNLSEQKALRATKNL